MDAMLQTHCARYIYVVPDGLRELMSDISREVLRNQPKDIYTFVADYLDALMITRENARVAARLVQSLTEMATTTAVFLEETGMPRNEIDVIVQSITKTFKRSIDLSTQGDQLSEEVEEANIVSDILNEITIDRDKAEIAAAIIQQAYRRFKQRKDREKELLAGIIDWRVAARSAIHLYRSTGVSNEDANRAATLIKAAYKGYYTRRLIKTTTAMMEKDECIEHPDIVDYATASHAGEGDEEEEEEFYEFGSLGKPKSVSINYETVIPHVDFDTTEGQEKDGTSENQEPTKKVSTSSSVVKHSLRHIFNMALDKISKQDVIQEEEVEQGGEEEDKDKGLMVVELADAPLPVTHSGSTVEQGMGDTGNTDKQE